MEELLIKLAKSAKDDGDTIQEWLSTLNSHLVYLYQRGEIPPDTDIGDWVRQAPNFWNQNGKNTY